jgi:hypothetical protein
MNHQNKLKDIPPIYYINLDHRTDRKEYMESQFDYWGIKNFHRISATKYLSTEEKKWKHLILDPVILFGSSAVANSITHLEMIKNWLKSTNEPYMIMMEDDYDLSLIKYWNFDWQYLMNNIPENWDCIQLGFENEKFIPFFLHPSHHNHSFGPCLINRNYAEKIINLHCIQNKFQLNIDTNDFNYKHSYGMVDNFILKNGKTYSIPLITNNPNLGSDYDPNNKAREHFFYCRNLYYDWWINEHHKFSLEDFFTYGKPNDFMMIKQVHKQNIKINYS